MFWNFKKTKHMKTHSTNYCNTFIEVAEDCPCHKGETPPAKKDSPTIATLQFELIAKHPYQYTSDEVLFKIYAQRNDLTTEEHAPAKKIFFSKGQACLRTSPLAKRYGWGIHHNEIGKVALYRVDSKEYEEFVSDKKTTKVKAMRSKKL